MTYLISDIHGEYDLFAKLLELIGFSDSDTMVILGDIIDKGTQSIKLLDFIRKQSNMKAILGNHEYDFLKYYYSLMRSLKDGNDPDLVLCKLQKWFPHDKEVLSWETMDYLEALPLWFETDEYICVHAGLQTDSNGKILPANEQRSEILVYDRRFKEADFVLSLEEKTVFFGHTPCFYNNTDGKFIKIPKRKGERPENLTGYAKIRLDCGVYYTGMLGAFRVEDLQEFYTTAK